MKARHSKQKFGLMPTQQLLKILRKGHKGRRPFHSQRSSLQPRLSECQNNDLCGVLKDGCRKSSPIPMVSRWVSSLQQRNSRSTSTSPALNRSSSPPAGWTAQSVWRFTEMPTSRGLSNVSVRSFRQLVMQSAKKISKALPLPTLMIHPRPVIRWDSLANNSLNT